MSIDLRSRRNFYIAVALSAVAGAVALSYGWPSEQPAMSPAQRLSTVATPAPAPAEVRPAEPTPSKIAATPAVAPVPVANTATRSGQLQALIAKGTPAAAFEGYMLLAYCDTAQMNERNAQTPPAFFSADMRQQLAAEMANGSATDAVRRLCGDLTSQQIAGRFALLQKAAEAGVPGAAVQLVMQPPAGMTQAELQARWDSPEVLQWREHSLSLIKLAATKADLDALLLLKTLYREGSPLVPRPDAKMAFVYATAYDALYTQQNGRPPGSYHRAETSRLEASVPPNEAQQLRELGLKLAQGGAK